MSGRSEEFSARDITFVGEQDGQPERLLKRRFRECLLARKADCRVYLAQVKYDSEPTSNVVLCFAFASEEPTGLMEELAAIFSDEFKTTEHLDFLFRVIGLIRIIGPWAERFLVVGSRCRPGIHFGFFTECDPGAAHHREHESHGGDRA